MSDEIGSCISQTGNCPVCGEGVADRKRKCSVCNTPQHEECWDYNDNRCGVYACVGVRKVSSPPKSRVQAKASRKKITFAEGLCGAMEWFPYIPTK